MAKEASLAPDGQIPGELAVAVCYGEMFSPSRVAMGREELERLEEAFDRLPSEYREVILLSRIRGLSHAEIARAMDREEGAVRSLLFRAVSRLGLHLRAACRTRE